jgi:hypothetical protein
MRSSHDSFIVDMPRGQGVISVTLDPLQLYGGVYHAVAWLMDAEDIIGLVRGASDWFTVKNPVAGLDLYDAIFEPRRDWRLTELSSVVPDEENLVRNSL